MFTLFTHTDVQKIREENPDAVFMEMTALGMSSDETISAFRNFDEAFEWFYQWCTTEGRFLTLSLSGLYLHWCEKTTLIADDMDDLKRRLKNECEIDVDEYLTWQLTHRVPVLVVEYKNSTLYKRRYSKYSLTHFSDSIPEQVCDTVEDLTGVKNSIPEKFTLPLKHGNYNIYFTEI